MEEKHIFIATNYEVGERIHTDKKNNKKRKSNKSFFVTALAFFSLALAALCTTLIYLDSNGIIPGTLFRKIFLGLSVFLVLELLFLFISRKSRLVAALSILICVAVISASSYGTYTIQRVYKSIHAVEEPKTFYARVGVYVRRDSPFAPPVTLPESEPQEKSESLDGHNVGTMLTNLDKGYTSQATRTFRKENDVNVIVFNLFSDMISALKDGSIDAIIYNEAFLGTKLGEETDFFTWAVEAKSIGIESEHNINIKKADVVSEPFIVYISGIDTYNTDYFPDAARCDGNIIAAIDPVNKKILLINTPRDFYVPLWGDTYAMDKLTHAGIFGVECSMETLEALYDIEFNYYVRFNVYSVINIVDALGGITVHSDYDFTVNNIFGTTQYFHVGENDIDGLGAIAFVRERYSFASGDRQRGIHQQECIRAIIQKACSPAIVSHFSDVLSVVENNIRTNIGQDEINALIRMQISDMSSWSFETLSVDGYGSSYPCYAMGGEYLYTMIPYDDTVDAAKTALSEFMSH